jgi:hypothetical protein
MKKTQFFFISVLNEVQHKMETVINDKLQALELKVKENDSC